MSQYYDFYKEFRENGEVKPLPFIQIQALATDKVYTYKLGVDRFDKLSDKYYGNPYHGRLILAANPQFGGMEFDIPDGTNIRIPFPFESGIERYATAVKIYKQLNG